MLLQGTFAASAHANQQVLARYVSAIRMLARPCSIEPISMIKSGVISKSRTCLNAASSRQSSTVSLLTHAQMRSCDPRTPHRSQWIPHKQLVHPCCRFAQATSLLDQPAGQSRQASTHLPEQASVNGSVALWSKIYIVGWEPRR